MKQVKVKAWIALGTDNSVVDGPDWYNENLLIKWGKSEGVKIIPCVITYTLPSKMRKEK